MGWVLRTKAEHAQVCALKKRPVCWGTVRGCFHLYVKFQSWKGAESLYFSDGETEVREQQ